MTSRSHRGALVKMTISKIGRSSTKGQSGSGTVKDTIEKHMTGDIVDRAQARGRALGRQDQRERGQNERLASP